MTRQDFDNLTKKTVLLDGATGSNLMAAGMPRGACPEEWVLEHRSVIQDLQKAYVREGSQIVLAPTFGGNRISLESHGLGDRLREINTTLVGYSKDAVGDKALVAGDITTTGKFEPLGDLTEEDVYEVYCEQAEILYQAGADLIVVETMISIDETDACVKAIKDSCPLPFICSVTVDAKGRLFTGGTAVEACLGFEAAGAGAAGINCSMGPESMGDVISALSEALSIPVLAKPNAGSPLIDRSGNAVYRMDPRIFASYMKELKDRGASLLGGCCGTTPDFIREVKKLCL